MLLPYLTAQALSRPTQPRTAGGPELRLLLVVTDAPHTLTQDFVAFLLALNEAVKGRQLSDPCHVSCRRGCWR